MSKSKDEIRLLPTRQMMYRGRRIDSRKKLSFTWSDYPGNENSKVRFYSNAKNIAEFAAIGDIWSFHSEEDGSIYSDDMANLAGKHANESEILEWTLDDRAAHQQYKFITSLKNNKSRDALKESLDPIRDVWAKTTYPQRDQLLAWIVGYITRG